MSYISQYDATLGQVLKADGWSQSPSTCRYFHPAYAGCSLRIDHPDRPDSGWELMHDTGFWNEPVIRGHGRGSLIRCLRHKARALQSAQKMPGESLPIAAVCRLADEAYASGIVEGENGFKPVVKSERKGMD